MKKKEEVISNIIKFLKVNNNGYSLMEVIVVMVMMGIIGAVVAPQISINNESKAEIEGRDQIKGLFQKVRQRAISQTSAYRIMPDPNSPDTQFIVEFAKSKSCASLTKLAVDANAGDKELTVLSASGFSANDEIKVGGDSTDNNITATSDSTITLGVELGSSQPTNSTVELANNWRSDSSTKPDPLATKGFAFQKEDVTLPYKQSEKLATFTSDIPNWIVCFNSRGIASVYDSNLASQASLTLTVTNETNNLTETIKVSKGGSIETY
jgi:prepilin-type N-terminal cleavage/methylation domain-containing protein